MNNRVKEFIENKTFSFFSVQEEMEEYAVREHIPIISRDSLDLLISMVRIRQPKRVFEFGAAIAYSTIAMAVNMPSDSQIITIERDEERYRKACEYIQRMNLQDRIQIHCIDAKDAMDIIRKEPFDLVFIDAAKAQYQLFFDMIFEQVSSGGIIVSDNIFHKEVILEKSEETVEKRQRTIYRRMNKYIDFLKQKEANYFTSLVPIGDGIAITSKN